MMDYDKFGICLTIAIVVGVCGYAGVISGELGLEMPTITIEEQVSTEPLEESEERLDNAYYEWCYKMKIECA